MPRDDELRFPVASWAQVRRVVGERISAVEGARRRALCAVALMAVGAWLTVQVPRTLGHVVDVVRAGDGSLWGVAAVLVAVAVGGAVCHATGFYFLSTVSERVVADLRERTVSAALELPLHRVEQAGSGDIVSRATDDVSEVSSAVTQTLPILTKSLFAIAATAVALLTVDWRMLGVVVLALPVYWCASRAYLSVAPGRYATERTWMAERARRVLEAIRGRETVRAFGWEERVQAGIGEASAQVVTHGLHARRALLVLQLWLSLGEFILVGGSLILGMLLVRADVVTVGAVTGAALMMIRLRGPIMILMRVLDSAQSAYASLARIVGVVADPPLSVPDCGAPTPRGVAELRGVTFSYDGEHPAVQDVSLRVDAGETVALVGASGAGKSTVAALLMGLRVPDAGEVLLDGVPVDRLSDAERSRRLAMVTQEVHVFSGALRADLAMVRPEAMDEELAAVLGAVGARWWKDLPEGLDTVVGSSGVELDAVQAQQLALARVLLLDPACVVLDEATAEAGSVVAGVLELSAGAVTRGRSAVVVAHRLDQAEKADRVIVMDEGRIVEQGSHAELVAAGGQYARMWQAWSRGRQ